jgi:flavin reductase (DIM6/NTAB) family NADH-FMN oxidoreductase RutF/DNA-binding FadR family transcriptional regulator
MSADTKTGETAERRRLDSNEFRDIIGRFASGVTVITVDHDDQSYGTTASAVCSLSLEPPMLLVCLNKASSTGQAIAAARHFAVNILGEGQADAAMRFAGKGDKFAGQRVVRGVAGQPLLGDALANLECRVVEEVTGGTHTVFLGEVEYATGRHGAPLAYFRGQFGRLELKQDEDAYQDIRARVMSRELPAGEALSLDAVGELVDVPRGSAYHALSKLSGEGLVTRTADGQFVVTLLTVASVSEGLEARRAIELGLAASTVGRLSAQQLQELRVAVQETEPAPQEQFDIDAHLDKYARFHEYFVGLAGSAALVDLHRRVNTASMIMSVTGERAIGVHAYELAARSAYSHHVRLLDAYEDGDLPAALAVIRHHIDDALTFTRRHIESVGGEV